MLARRAFSTEWHYQKIDWSCCLDIGRLKALSFKKKICPEDQMHFKDQIKLNCDVRSPHPPRVEQDFIWNNFNIFWTKRETFSLIHFYFFYFYFSERKMLILITHHSHLEAAWYHPLSHLLANWQAPVHDYYPPRIVWRLDTRIGNLCVPCLPL